MRRNTNGCPVSARVTYSPVEFVVTSILNIRSLTLLGKKFSLRRLTGRSGGKEEASLSLRLHVCYSLTDSCSCGEQQADRPPLLLTLSTSIYHITAIVFSLVTHVDSSSF